MKLEIAEDYEEMSQKAASRIISALGRKPSLALALPTGSTPLRTYALLSEAYARSEADFSGALFVQLDEYAGLPKSHAQSYAFFLNRNFFSKINANKSNILLLDSLAGDLDAECAAYEKKISALGGIDFALLGIGTNCHIAFNEPGTPFSSRTHVVELAESTIKANARFFANPEEVPRRALTVGLKAIISAKDILLLASGAAKAEAVAKAVKGSVATAVPASLLQRHRNAILIADKEAASKL